MLLPRFDAQSLDSRHYGELSCREYRESILHNMPHQWSSMSDTKLVLSHFQRHKTGKGANKMSLGEKETRGAGLLKPLVNSCGIMSLKLRILDHPQRTRDGIAWLKPDTCSVLNWTVLICACAADSIVSKKNSKRVTEVLKNTMEKATASKKSESVLKKDPFSSLPPNAIVAHLKEGIEAIHLYSGTYDHCVFKSRLELKLVGQASKYHWIANAFYSTSWTIHSPRILLDHLHWG